MSRPAGPQEHGSVRGYLAHVRRKTVACRPCLQAWSVRQARQRHQGRCAPGLGWPLLPGKEAQHG